MSEERIPEKDSILIWAMAFILGGGILGFGVWFLWPFLDRLPWRK